jgi:GT2 family glycosyltransferase
MVSVSIVTFNTLPKDLDLIFKSLENVVTELKIYIIDNSPTKVLSSYFECMSNVIYIHNPSNPGFGAAHNIAIERAINQGSKYHFIINPDIYFIEDVITPMVEFMGTDAQIGMLMPQILNEDGSIQNLPKLLPSPFSVLLRKLKKPAFLYNPFINKYELRNIPDEKIYEAPILSGCFTLLNLKAIKEIGGYDDTYFMYFEDWDLSRRMHLKFKTIYFPKVSVYHGYESGANKSKKLFKIFVYSAICYFNKWGWFFDFERKEANKKTLNQFK